MPKTGPRKWQTPSLEPVLTWTGGFADTPYPVKSQTMDTPGHGRTVFVHIAKNADWLLQAVTGRTEKAALKRSNVFDELKKRLTDAAVAVEATAAAEAECAEAAAGADDPMNLLDPIEETPPPKRAKKFQYASKRNKNIATLVEMPAKEPNKHSKHCNA